MTDAEQLKSDIENCAKTLGLAPSTIGERIGQGGGFYKRLCDGKRVWPETADKARAAMDALLSKFLCETSHGNVGGNVQGELRKSVPIQGGACDD